MNLEKFRKSRGLSRSEAARELAVNETTFFRWETGRAFPRSEELKKLKTWSAGAVMPNDFLND